MFCMLNGVVLIYGCLICRFYGHGMSKYNENNIYAFVKNVFDIPSNSYQHMYVNVSAES